MDSHTSGVSSVHKREYSDTIKRGEKNLTKPSFQNKYSDPTKGSVNLLKLVIQTAKNLARIVPPSREIKDIIRDINLDM